MANRWIGPLSASLAVDESIQHENSKSFSYNLTVLSMVITSIQEFARHILTVKVGIGGSSDLAV
ncbi:hypothetical protein DD236_10085 [Ancrocorticia populi]|uniref:Uncharacterized protein n=1 Tax=Ancrocorticia populi TaxID=2175228 RepID=A0A2V1K8E7_9ACTO|nr:hypothetical protein DD236_10085 [Ancrocorticia populi]